MFAKPGKYIARAKEFLGRQYGQGKLMASRIDGYMRKGYDIYQRTTYAYHLFNKSLLN